MAARESNDLETTNEAILTPHCSKRCMNLVCSLQMREQPQTSEDACLRSSGEKVIRAGI